MTMANSILRRSESAGSVSAAAGQFFRLRHGEIVTGATGA